MNCKYLYTIISLTCSSIEIMVNIILYFALAFCNGHLKFRKGKDVAMCFGLACISTRCPPKPLCHSPSSTGQGRGNMMKGSRVEIRTRRDHSPTTVMDKTD